MTDVNQAVQLSYVTDAFGRQIVSVGGANTKVLNDLQFQSNWLTVQIGNRRYSLSPFRVYDPELGRYLQRDPFPAALKTVQSASGNALGIYSSSIFENLFAMYMQADLGGINLYIYASGSPTNRIDPTGMPDLLSTLGNQFAMGMGISVITDALGLTNVGDTVSQAAEAVANKAVEVIGPDNVLNATGGQGHRWTDCMADCVGKKTDQLRKIAIDHALAQIVPASITGNLSDLLPLQRKTGLFMGQQIPNTTNVNNAYKVLSRGQGWGATGSAIRRVVSKANVYLIVAEGALNAAAIAACAKKCSDC